jgi:hypothetical protein
MEAALVLALAAALFIANAISVEWMTVTIVLAAGVWAFDLADVTGRRGLAVAAVPFMASIFAGAVATFRFGIAGMAGATIGAALGSLIWSVLAPRFRSMESIAASSLISIAGAFGVSAMVLIRLRSEDEMLSFLAISALSVIASVLAGRTESRVLDPLVVGILAALAGGVLAGSVWVDDLGVMIIAAGGTAIAIIAGRNLGTLLRAGGFFVTGPIPGSLHYLDGVVVAAGAFWLLVDLLR